jgi:preprotein translocase subunit SecA
MENTGTRLIFNSSVDEKSQEVNVDQLMKEINGNYFPIDYVKKSDFEGLDYYKAVSVFMEKCQSLLSEKKEQFPKELYLEFMKVVLLRVVDSYWMDHIDAMSELRQAVRLQAYAQVNPLREYQEIGFQKFETMIESIESDATRYVNRAQIRDNLQRETVIKPVSTSSGKDEEIKRKPQVKGDKVGRNDPCPCGSGKKYKNCHGND